MRSLTVMGDTQEQLQTFCLNLTNVSHFRGELIRTNQSSVFMEKLGLFILKHLEKLTIRGLRNYCDLFVRDFYVIIQFLRGNRGMRRDEAGL